MIRRILQWLRDHPPRIRKTKTWLGGLIRVTGSKTWGRKGHVTGSTKIGPYTASTTGRRAFTVWGVTIPLRKARR